MKKLLAITSCIILLNTLHYQPATAFNFSSINSKQIKDVGAVASVMLSIPCFKKGYDACVEHNSILRSIIPHFDTMMETYYDECAYSGYPNSAAFKRLYNKLLTTHVEPTHPELIPQLKSLHNKEFWFTFAGIMLASVTITYFLSQYFQKNKKVAPVQLQ